MSGQPGSEQPKNARALNALNYEQRLNHPRRCTARRQRDGKPCGRFAIRGGSVCRIHGGASPQVQRKAMQRMDFAKEIMFTRAVMGLTPDPRLAPADKRLAVAVAKRAGKPIRRAAKRPAGPPKPAEAAVVPPERPVERVKPAERPEPLRPPFAEPSDPPKRRLTTVEDALADVTAANRRAGVSHRMRRGR
jgi:hypothetical protein